jgi:hypothetical protein
MGGATLTVGNGAPGLGADRQRIIKEFGPRKGVAGKQETS